MPSGLSWGELAGLWGAVLSTVLAALKIAEYRKDRPRVRLMVEAGRRIVGALGLYGDHAYVVVRVVNVGRRPVTIGSPAFLVPRPKAGSLKITDADQLGLVELAEGHPRDYLAREDEILTSDYGLTPSRLVAVVQDAVGRRYYSHGVLARLWKLHRVH